MKLNVLNKNDNLVNTTVQNAVAGLEERLTSTLVKLLNQQLDYHLPLVNNSEDHPGKSCKDIHQQYPYAPSGYYWIAKSGSPAVRVYCEMNITCGDQTGGWMRVANIDMRNTSHTCPTGLSLISSPKRVCDLTTSETCASNIFNVHEFQYSKVCGKIIGYQNRVPITFHYTKPSGIEGVYVYGASLTHGRNPRQHIWTFAGVSDETDRNRSFKCPCINTALSPPPSIPSYVGTDYIVRWLSVKKRPNCDEADKSAKFCIGVCLGVGTDKIIGSSDNSMVFVK